MGNARMQDATNIPLYSIVIPCKNEEGSIVNLISEVEEVMHAVKDPWELICIEDGSTDGTQPLLRMLKKHKPYLRLICFTKNFGQSSGFAAGFEAAKGEWVITMDGDGQNDPQDIPILLREKECFDLVCGVRQKRQDTWTKRGISRIANAIRGWLCADGMEDTGCSLKLMRRSCLAHIKMYQGMHRFLPALFLLEGFRIGQVPVHHRPRKHGKSHYHLFNRSWNTIADLLAVYWMRKRRLCHQGKEVL